MSNGKFWLDSYASKIYLQGEKIYLSDLGLSENTNQQTTYNVNLYAQWQKAKVIYVYNGTVTDTVLKTLNNDANLNPFKST